MNQVIAFRNSPIVSKLEELARRSGARRQIQLIRAWQKPDAVFIWIPKTAGTTVYKVLSEHHACCRLLSTHEVQAYFPNRGIVTFGHMKYRHLVEGNYVTQTFDQRSLKFCFTRNPYTRTVSLFNYLKRQGSIPQSASFLTFCRMLERQRIPDIGLYNVKGLSQCNPQWKWIEDVRLDYIGKTENLLSHLNDVLKLLGLPQLTALPRENVSTHNDYMKYYCEESKAIVENVYAEDFEHLGYEISEEEIPFR